MLRVTAAHTFVFRPESPFSQWYPATFVVDGVSFGCAEQFMMHGKAMLFDDAAVAAEILATASPRRWAARSTLRRPDLDGAPRGDRRSGAAATCSARS